MTATTRIASTSQINQTAEIEQLLRDAAFVLKMTRRVKHDILASGIRPSQEVVVREFEPAHTALGV